MPKWPDDFSPVGPDGCTPSKRRKAEFDAYREGYQDGFNKGLAAPRPAVATAGDGEWRRHVAAAWAAIDPEMTEREAKARTHLDAALASRPVEAAQGGFEVMARRVAEALAASGWASGGDFDEDFLPDVREAMKVADAFPLAAAPETKSNG